MFNRSLESRTFELLRFPLIFLVVLIHCQDVGDVPLESGQFLYNAIKFGFSSVFTIGAVPCFFFISGYFFFAKFTHFSILEYWKVLKKKTKTLLIPYISWIILAFILSLLFNVVLQKTEMSLWQYSLYKIREMDGWHMFWDYSQWGGTNKNWLGSPQIMTGPYGGPLWFLRDLIVLTCLSPFILWYLRGTKLLGTLILQFCFISGIWPNISGFTVVAVSYFTLGGYFSLYKISPIAVLNKMQPYTYIACFLLAIWYYMLWGRSTVLGNIIYPFFVITSVISIITMAAYAANKGFKVSNRLTSCSFFVYLMHTIFSIPISRLLVNKILPQNILVVALLRYILLIMFVICISVGCYMLLKRFFPKSLIVLSGGR